MVKKEKKLKEYLKNIGSAAVAFSAGVDSTYLLSVAKEVLGENVMAVTAHSESFPQRESSEADSFCRENGIRHVTVSVNQMEVPGFSENAPDKCYICKREIFGRIIEAADGMQVIEGSNADDVTDYRPGLKAIEELGVLSPLKASGLTKSEIRKLSEMRGLATWDKPSFACLATRFAYAEPITESKIRMVEAAENYIFDMGIRQARVRVQQGSARIEVLPEDIMLIAQNADSISKFFMSLGFLYVSLDLEGYRTGKMNDVL